MKRIEELVRSAVGFTATRGDQVSVINVRFDHGDEEGTASGLPAMINFDKNDTMRAAELAVLLAMGALVVFFVVRPLLSTAAGGGGINLPMLAGAAPGGSAPLTAAPEMQTNMIKTGPAIPDSRIDIAKIEGAVKVSSVKQVSEFVESHPEESVSILRTWLHEST
jgi:flagellar M-ring protein FliF